MTDEEILYQLRVAVHCGVNANAFDSDTEIELLDYIMDLEAGND